MAGIEYQQNQSIEQNEFQQSPIEENNILFVPSAQLTESPIENSIYYEGQDFINQEFCYYYYNSQLTPEEQAMLGVAYNNDNNELYINDQVNSVITWSSELELQDHMNQFPYLYNDIIENGNFDTYNPFVGQSPIYEDPDSIPTIGANLLLTQPLSEVTQNVIENQQQFSQYNWCDLSSFQDTQQFIIDANVTTKIAEQNQQNQQNLNNISNISNIPNISNISNISNTPTENYYTPWTDFQLLEA